MKPISSWRKPLINRFSQTQKKIKKIKLQHNLDKYLVSSLNRSKFPSWKQIKHLGKILNQKEKRQAGATAIFGGALLVALVLNLYLSLTMAIPKTGGQYTEGLIGSPKFINPILAQTNDVDLDLSKLIFSGLMKYDKNHQLTGDLAENYEVSENQLVYTFYLRRNVLWHDGETFNADDVVFTINSIQDAQFKSPLARSFRGVSVEKTDDYTVKFTLKETFAPFLGLMTFGILPEHLWYSVTPANADLADLNKQPIGTGPWKFANFNKDKNGTIKSYKLTKNPDYYGAQPFLDELVFKFYGDFISATEAIKSKEVQGIAYLPKEYLSDLKKYKNLNYHNLNQPQYTAVFFNQSKNDLLAADYIRQALALALDKQRIISEAFNDKGRIIDVPTLPGIEDNPEIKKYAYDPNAAVSLLEKNGWQLTSTTTAENITEQIRQKKDWILQVTLTTVDQPENVKTAEIIKQLWEQIGVKTILNIVDKEKIVQEVIKNRDYEALLFGESIGYDPDPFPFWHSSQNEYPGLNLAIFSDKTADQLLETARKTNNWEERKKNYLQFQKIVADKLPAIFLYNPTYTYPQIKNLNGFEVNSINVPADRFANIDEWYLKTKRVWK